ncbi:MAG: PIN domain-containing protein [Verrucomicrobiae bacterium]|nr:PIN domain-containing protein [Verrucomicrobiae bacterium]
MPTAIDTSVLIHAEHAGNLDILLPQGEEGPFYIPAHAAAEFLAGLYPPATPRMQERTRRFYQEYLRDLVDVFGEAEAAELARLNAEMRRMGKPLKFYDAAIAATARARGDKLITSDDDFDRVSNLNLIKI